MVSSTMVRITTLHLVAVLLISSGRTLHALGVCDNFIVPASEFMKECAQDLESKMISYMLRDCLHYLNKNPAGIHNFLDNVELVCKYKGHIITLPGGCDSRPCLNEGYCFQNYDVSFECHCIPPYTGDFCQDGPGGYTFYEGYKVVDAIPGTIAHIRFLNGLGEQEVDFWQFPSKINTNVRMFLSPDQFTRHTPEFDDIGLPWELSNINMTEELERDRGQLIQRLTDGVGFFNVLEFNPLEKICEWLTGPALDKCPYGVTCKVITIGKSYEVRDIKMFTISADLPDLPVAKTFTKPAMYIDSLHHPRERLSGSTILCMIDYMLDHYPSDPGVRYMIDTYDWFFVPVVNPDGYKFTFANKRLWRKNRKPINASCTGVDLNRNYNYKWNTNSVDINPCGEEYPGPTPSSESETTAIANQICALAHRLYAMVTVHTFSNMVLHPWSTTVDPNDDEAECEFAADEDDLFAVSEATGMAMEATFNVEKWKWGNSCDSELGSASGVLDDYAKAICGVKYSMTVELRGDRFDVDSDQIPLAFHEFWNGILAMETKILAKPPF